MCKFGRIFKKVLRLAIGAYGVLFLVFWFDLDGKFLFNVVEPFLCKHYDNMPRRDVTKDPYEINKFPKYEYSK